MQTFLVLHTDTNASTFVSAENGSFYNFSSLFTTNKSPLYQRVINSTEEFEDWGPIRDPLFIVIPMTIIYTLMFFSGVIGNVSTCIVIARNKSMHTATNYYLFSLAISDLLLLISGLPPEVYGIWYKYPYIFGEAFCMLQGFTAETSANATVLTITSFTIERYVAICHPFLSHTLSKLNRAIKFIIAIWIVAMCSAIPQAMSFGVVYEELSDGRRNYEHRACIVKRVIMPYAFQISTIIFFFTPMVLLSVLYVLIGLQLHRSTVKPPTKRGGSVRLKHKVCKISQSTQHQQQSMNANLLNGELGDGGDAATTADSEEGRKNFAKNAKAAKHVVNMLVAVVVAFFICWAPFHAQRLMAIYGSETQSIHVVRAFKVLTYISGVFYYLSTTINPLLYHIMSHKFREAFKGTYKQCFRKTHRTPGGGRCYSTLSGRSSQVNSHSNTDSYSRQSSLRYLDAEMARLHDSRRPLVVSFRRKRPQVVPSARRHKQVTIFDSDLQEALSSLNRKHTTHHSNHKSYYSGILISSDHHDDGHTRDEEELHPHQSPMMKRIPVFNSLTAEHLNTDCSFVEVHQLQPTHICPLKIEDIFQQGNNKPSQLKLSMKRICKKTSKGSRSGSLQDSSIRDEDGGEEGDKFLIKSCTMPEIHDRILRNKSESCWQDEMENGSCLEIGVGHFSHPDNFAVSVN